MFVAFRVTHALLVNKGYVVCGATQQCTELLFLVSQTSDAVVGGKIVIFELNLTEVCQSLIMPHVSLANTLCVVGRPLLSRD